MFAGLVSAPVTICAIATAPAMGGVGIVRLSGPRALESARGLAPDLPGLLQPRHAYFSRLVDREGALLDEGLFLYFRAPNSFTGEEVVELHAHGGPRLLSLLIEEVLKDPLLRLARPGEFSQRAYLNGRMDLARAEAVAALVSAESESAVRAAAAQLHGALSERVQALRGPLIEVQADLEGVLSFPDEAEGAEAGLAPRLESLRQQTAGLLEDASRGALIRRGARVVLFGPVNAGKSTLFNRLVGSERALVDPEPGTTRDLLEARLELGGGAVTLVDTAGLREEPGRLERLGIERARSAIAGADLAVLMVPPETAAAELAAWSREAGQVPLLVVGSRADEGAVASARLQVSARTGEGVGTLLQLLGQQLWGSGSPSAVFAASEANLDALRRTADSLRRAGEALESSTLEVVAGEVGLALEALGEITGENASAEVIDALFRRFCIGK